MFRFAFACFFAGFAFALHLFARPAVAEEARIFHKPVRLLADNKPIDTGAVWGHSGPAVADVDRDGLRDLVVGDFSGKFRFFKNVGTNTEPRYTAANFLMAGKKPAEVRIYCCIGSSPHFVDFDGDGQLDLISGSYDPGECYLFRGLAGGTFRERETLCDKSGKPILREPNQQQNFESFGSWPVMVDWDNDGDLDLVIGGFDGTIFLRINEGSRTKPVFSETNVFLEADGQQIARAKETGGHAAIAIADWDGDGLWDLLAGCDHGSVHFYRNVGTAGAPKFAAAHQLIPPHQGSGYEELIEADAEPVPGIRTQIAAVDYNGDGKMDLLVGDFCTNLTLRPGLTQRERSEMLAIQKEGEATGKLVGEAMGKLQADFAKRYPGDLIHSDKATKEWSQAYQEWKNSKQFKAHEKKTAEINATLGKYLVKPATKGTFNENATNHGYVWLFLRK